MQPTTVKFGHGTIGFIIITIYGKDVKSQGNWPVITRAAHTEADTDERH